MDERDDARAGSVVPVPGGPRTGRPARPVARGGPAVVRRMAAAKPMTYSRAAAARGRDGSEVRAMRGVGLAVSAGVIGLVLVHRLFDPLGLDYTNRHHYPATVREIDFPPPWGAVFDATRPFERGEWTVRFGATAPHAVYSDSSKVIQIAGLVCTSATAGAHDCSLDVPTDGGACLLLVGDSPADFATVYCPRTVRFE